jgi:hypothetical protein
MTDWLTYERRRGALERKWIPKVRKELNNAVALYIEQFSKNRSVDFFHYGQVYGVISKIYLDAGVKMAAWQLRELRQQMPKKKFSRGDFSYKVDVSTSDLSTKDNNQFREDVIRQLQLAGLNMAQKVTTTTKKLVLEVLVRGQEEGWGIDKMVAEIRRVTTDLNKRRAVTIARTEIGRAANVGHILAAKRLEVAMWKTWSAARDERTRTEHWRANGQKVDLDEFFVLKDKNGQDVPMQAPGDPSAPGELTINCRCRCTFKVKKDPQGNVIPRSYYTPTNYTLNPRRNVIGEIAEAIATGVSLGVILRQAIQNEQNLSV